MNASNAANAYRTMRGAGLVEGASPHALALMLLDGALSRIGTARTLERDERHRCLDRALAIVQELQGSLRDPETDELASRLFALYGYVADSLLRADRERDDAPLDAAESVLSELRAAWVAIAPEGAR